MGLKEELLDFEKQFWMGDSGFYEENLAENAVMIFPEPTGFLNRKDVIQSLGEESRWTDVDFSEVQINHISEDVAQLTYRAEANRSDGSEYRTLANSVFVQEGKSWKLISHQQTPVT